MNIEAGQDLLHYRLVEKIGEGGMGVVWKALDTTLGREIAIKMLPADFAADADRLERFDREARLLASLNHPHVAGIYGIHEAEGVHFLAMELVAGEDLSQRLERGPLPVEAALRVACEVATGLEAAHENGVIHRDLKPGNVKMTTDGKAKVLDFGLAKTAAAHTASGNSSFSPTMTSAGTMAGMILGTASYMSPEQAAAQPTDRRCDIWSFGVMLAELLSGKRMFEGETISHTLADVLRSEIDLSSLPSTTPRSVCRLIERCLERDPMRRLRDIGEARIVIQDAIDTPEAADDRTAEKPGTASSRVPWLVAGIALAIAAVAWVMMAMSDPAPELPVQRFSISMPNSGASHQGDGAAIAISPDGRQIVTKGGAGNDDILYIRSLDDFEPWPLEGTGSSRIPQFSSDGRWISFITSAGLFKIRAKGGAVTPLATLPSSIRGYHWISDAEIYYSAEGQLWRATELNGEPEQLTTADVGQGVGYLHPHAVPQAGLVFCNSRSAPGLQAKLFVLDLESRELRDLDMPGSDPFFLPMGYVLFHQTDDVVVARFDVGSREFTGSPVKVLDRAWIDQGEVQAAFSTNGTAAYLPQKPGETQSLVYVGQDGKTESVLAAGLPFKSLNDPRFSPDGNRLVTTTDSGAIWMIDLRTQTTTLLTESGFYPLWSPDGSEIAFTTTRNKTFDIYRVPADLSRPEELLLDAENNLRTMDWTNADTLVIREEVPKKGMDLRHWTDRADPSTMVNLMDGPDDELAPVVSPDGRFMAYVSNYSGDDNVYVTSFPTSGARSKISTHGGHSPLWSSDGKTLYYLENLQMIAVAIETEPELRVLSRETLFEGEYVQYRWSRQYDLHPDGDRFVMIKNPVRGDVEVVTNWFSELDNMEE